MRLDDPSIGLELLEYKIDALRRGRPVRGGADAVRALRRRLGEASDRLDPDGRRRLEEAGRTLDALLREEPAARPGVRFEELVLGDGESRPGRSSRGGAGAIDLELDAPSAATTPPPASEEERRERVALDRLALRLLDRDLDRFAAGVAATWRADRDRLGARLVHAVLRNLERFRGTAAYATDGELRAFAVVEPVPLRGDPLVALSELEVLELVARDAADAVARLHDGVVAPPVDRRAALGWVRRLAGRVARDPWAGRVSPLAGRGPSTADLRQALRDLPRERLPDWQLRMRREELEARLRERSEAERRDREALRLDVARFEAELDAFFGRLARVLPRSLGGEAPEPRLPAGVLFAATPSGRIDALPEGARRATVRLAGPTRFRFAGHEAIVAQHDGGRSLHLAGVEVPIDGDREAPFAGGTLATLAEGDHLHLRLEGGGSLAALTAEAAAVLHVLGAPAAPSLVAALRRIVPDGPVDPSALVVHALREAGRPSAGTPDPGGTLTARLVEAARSEGAEPSDAWAAGFARCARLALAPEGLEAAVGALVDGTSGATPRMAPFDGAPLELPLGGRTVVVRRYGEEGAPLVALVEGRVIGDFREHLVAPLREGRLVCVHGEGRLLAAWARPSSGLSGGA